MKRVIVIIVSLLAALLLTTANTTTATAGESCGLDCQQQLDPNADSPDPLVANDGKSLYMSGCSENPDNKLTIRNDNFYKGDGQFVVGVGNVLHYKNWIQSHYYFCDRSATGHEDRVLPSTFRVCVQKLSANQPIIFKLDGNITIKLFGAGPDYYPLANPDAAPINGTSAFLLWNGVGAKDEKHCGPWVLAAESHWIDLDNIPVIQGIGWIKINNAKDNYFTYLDILNPDNPRVHFMTPRQDQIVKS